MKIRHPPKDSRDLQRPETGAGPDSFVKGLQIEPGYYEFVVLCGYRFSSAVLAYGEGYRPAVTAGRAALADLAMKMRIIVRSQVFHFSKYPESGFISRSHVLTLPL
jgi:hypothetical protein